MIEQPQAPNSVAREFSAADEPLIAMRGISKAFPNVGANNKVDLDIYEGEVHALLGENGAGTSTLVKILYGYYQKDSEESHLNGQVVQIQSPYDARNLRTGLVFQFFTPIPAMNVVENVALFLPGLKAVLNTKRIAQRIEQFSKRYHLRVDPWAPVWQLSMGERQKVEVLELLLADARVLILDEPTIVLAPHEVDGLLQILENLCADGYAVVFITHKLQEVLACADRITVMRHGRIAGSLERSEASESALVSMMFEAALPEEVCPRGMASAGALPLLELKQVATRGQGVATSLAGIDLTVLPGEIVGAPGVSGNGQKELGDDILGLERCTKGTRFLYGQNATHWLIGRWS